MEDRVILHCDCNSFFASVETALNPEYRNVPMAVCGSTDDRHGIVLAKNELAKKYGIQTAETVYSAKKKCPGLVMAKPHHSEYARFSRMVNEIYSRYTDMVEPFGIDESWLDVTASKRVFGDGRSIADEIRETVKREIGITVSVGVSFNKVFAKLGSDYKKPDATTVISRENFKELIYGLPARDMLFVGRKTAEQLLRIGVNTIGELASTSESLLRAKLGKAGEMLYKYANGLDDSPVAAVGEREDAKSVGSGFTFRHDLVGWDECRIGIEYLADDIGARLRKQGMKCSTVQLTIKDEFLRSIQRQRPQNPPTDIAREIAATAYEILRAEWSEHKPIRMITVTATSLVRADMMTEQIDFFADNSNNQRDRSKKREETMDKIRQKYGSSAVLNGASIDTDIGIFEPTPRPSRKNDKKQK